jgi:hypothetical protein
MKWMKLIILCLCVVREGHGYPNPSSLPYGEIDIIETFNDHTNGYITLHTDTKASSPDCSCMLFS